MTDNEIIKALGQCETQSTCSYCPYFEKIGCKKHLYQDAYRLIIRQKAEIEELQIERIKLNADYENKQKGIPNMEVRHGEWIVDSNIAETEFKCSKCGYSYFEGEPCQESDYNYCPNCGAKMDGGKNE